MVDDLGGRLVQAGLVTRELLTEVLGAAPPHEGALICRLAERGLSQDGLAGYFVAEGFGPLMSRSDLLRAEGNALGRVPASMAVELVAVPIHNSPAGLVIAMAAPSDVHAVAELGRAAGGPVLPTVAKVDDLHAALRAAYPDGRASERPMARESEPPVLELVRRKKTGYQGSTKGAERVGARAAVGPRLVAEDSDSIVPLVRTKPVANKPAAQAPPPPPARRIEGPSKFKKVITRNFERMREHRETPRVSVGEGTARATWEKPNPEDKSGKLSASRALVPPSGRAALPPAPPKEAPPPQAPPPPARPRSIIPAEHERWDLDAPENRIDASKLDRMRHLERAKPSSPAEVGGSLAAIRGSTDRDEVVRLGCEAALTVSRAAVLLALRKSVLKGWGGAGAGVSQDAIRNLWIPTSTPSVFRDVVRKREPYLGPPGTSAADGLFRAALGSRGGDIALQPVTVGGKLVAVFAADDLTHGADGAHRVEELARVISEALERIIVAKKKR